MNVRCCIVGGGPAGMVLGFLLVRAGIAVAVLEKHKDFLRDFRGDTIHPSTLELMYELGLLDEFLRVPHQELTQIGAEIDDLQVIIAEFSHLPTHCKFVALMPQWDFLNFMAAQGKRYPEFQVRMEWEVTGLIEENGRVVGVRAHTPEGVQEVRAELTVGADGRHSIVRKQAGLEVIDLGAPIDVLWMRVSRDANDPNQTLGRIRAGRILVTLDRGDYWQCAYVIPKGALETIQAKGLPAFRDDLVKVAPFLKGRVDELKDWNDIKLLSVTVDRLRQWSRTGLLCIGDSAHAMSPVGGVGINLAIQDAVAAANLLARPLLGGKVSDAQLDAVQRRRMFPTRMTQRLQVFAHRRLLKPTLGNETPITRLPLALRLLQRFPILRRIPARVVGMGFRPEHVKTPERALKFNFPMEIDKVYEPQRFEPHWAEWWVEHRTYRAEPHPGQPYFSLAIPPPNVTGSLHMGHMFEHSIIDAQVRWRRMKRTPEGKAVDTLWLPGTDHAGIATQIMVERQLAGEGLTKFDLGREAFEARVWKWKEENGGRIVEQMKRAGVSCDWSRERFTLDPGLSRAVREAFVRLYEKGLIYQGDYIVNWCPRCQTALSDLEVEHEESDGSLWHIRYPVVGLDEDIVVATTRPETMLGDTGVAINPLDPRAARLHPRKLKLPLTDREIPIVLDEMADPEFGSGAVKITPAHDPNDFEAGKRHDLPSIQVIGEDAKMTAASGKFAGLDRYEARKQVVAELKELGFLVKIEPYKLSVGKCHRCKTVVEPLVSKQWWMKMKPLAAPAIAAVEDGRITFVPANWSKTYFEWMYNIRDWCVSRQLWWGHRIPAWHCGDCKGVTVAREDPAKCSKCDSDELTQETDVLDTWFSSGLWPFSTLGWPDDTADLRAFYPTTLLVTGFDIIFFWAARMIMFGMEMMGDVPFRQIHIHGLVRDAERQKMSKTKGNVVDPLVVNEKYGTDAVRFGLLVAAAPGNDIALSEEVIARGRNFANKIWNASRLLFTKERGAAARTSLADRWIGSRLNAAVKIANDSFETHRYHEAADAVWTFFWDEFCDWYLELKKSDTDWGFAYEVHEKALLLLHPLMPFITEELWHRRGHETSIALAAYPLYDPALNDPEAEREMKLLQDIVTEIRGVRADNKIDRKEKLTGVLRVAGSINLEFIERNANVTFTVEPHDSAGYSLALGIPVPKERLEKENEQLEKVIANSKRQLENESFVAKAPAHVIDGMRAKLAEYEAQLAKNRAALGE